MGRGASPLRAPPVRNSPKKPAQESMDGTLGELTPGRKPLSSIAECGRNVLATSDENCADALPSKGKLDATTPKGKKKSGQCLFAHTENVDRNDGGLTGTPEKHGKPKKPVQQNHQQSPMRTTSISRALQDITPAEPGPEMATTPRKTVAAVSEISHPSVNTSRGQQPSATPAKSVTRSLKYGAGPVIGLGAGLSNSRALVPTVSCGRIPQPGCTEQLFTLEEDPTFWQDHNVQVLIRTRPISGTEMASQGFSKCLKQESPHTITFLGQPEARFTFDHVAGEVVTQEKLFKVAGLPMVENCMAGYNSCMFAYGQTGSGKTHTMLGDIDNLIDKPSDNRGMTPRVFEYLFSRIHLRRMTLSKKQMVYALDGDLTEGVDLQEEEQRKDENLKFLTKCSFLEIYNEQITDLLEPTSTNLQMREDARNGVYVENLTEVEVGSVQDVIQLLIQGSANRKVAATNMNRESSRSHSVFTCIIESKWESDNMTNFRFGRLNLVDLAGSERQKSSGAEGERLKEAANINKSLSTLGLVIMILVDVANGKQRHVPYRDSKLTFLLQDSLGGNSKTTIIATVSPSSCNSLETLSTLKFAQRAKLIRNTAVINEDASGDVKALRAQIQQMKDELDRLRRQSISRVPLSQDDFNPVRSSFDSWGDASKFFGSPQVSNRKVRQMEAVVAGALRREQAADAVTKRLAGEIEHLNRLVHQREADTQSGKMILRFREDKIRRLETLSKGLLSVDSYRAEEKNLLMDEIQLMREKIDRNPELTRFAMENIRLVDQIRSLQDFHEGGEKDVMMEELSTLRDQLLEVLDGKIAVDQGLVPLTTPQKKALAPELAAAAREKELLRIEADNYRSEVEELRTNLSSSLEGYAKMGRQVDELQLVIEQLKEELAAKQDDPKLSDHEGLKLEHAKHLTLIADLKLQLEQSEEKSKLQQTVSEQLDCQLKDSLQEAANLQTELQDTREAFEAARALTKKLQSKEAHLVADQYTAAVKQIRLETEEMAVQQSQSLTNIQEVAVLWRMKEMELRMQLEESQSTIEKLISKEGEQQPLGLCACGNSSSALNSMRTEDGSLERLQKAQDIEMRHAEEVMQLHLELESLEAVLEEERAQKKELDGKLAELQGSSEASHDLNQDVNSSGDQGYLQLQLEVETMQATLSEERVLRQDLESNVSSLVQRLQEAQEVSAKANAEEVRETTYFDAVSRLQLCSPDQKSARLSQQLDQEKALVEALENQHLLCIREFEALQAEHQKVVDKLKRREDRERSLRKKIGRLEIELEKQQDLRELEKEFAFMEERGHLDDDGRLALEEKLEAAKRELEIAHAENVKLQEEEQEKDTTRSQAESETVLAITSLQSELMEIKARFSCMSVKSDEERAESRRRLEALQAELLSKETLLQQVESQILNSVQASDRLAKRKDTEISALKEQSEKISCMSIKKEGEFLEWRNQLELLQAELGTKETLLHQAERQNLESIMSSEKLAEENKDLKSRIVPLTSALNEAQMRFSEAESMLAALQEKRASLESQIVELESREQASITKLELVIKLRMDEKEAELLAVQNEKKALAARLQEVEGNEVTINTDQTSENKLQEVISSGNDRSSKNNHVDLAKARAALAGAEERVKLLTDANATMAEDWESERARLNREIENLQMEISRLEKPVLCALDENISSFAGNGNGTDQFVDGLKQETKRTRDDCEHLRSKVRERDNTILSVRMELEKAMVHYKETEIDMEKTIREKEEAIKQIAAFQEELKIAHDEIIRRERQVDSFEAELENLMTIVYESEAERRTEREQFVSAVEEAQLERETLQGVQTEGQNLSVPDVAPQEDSVDMSKEAIAAFVLAKEEVDLTVSRVEKEMQTVATEMKSLRADISKSFFEFPVVALQQDLQSAWDAHRIELSSVSEKVMILEGQLEESISKASMLQAAHDDVQEALQKSIAEQGVVERKLLASQESLESAEKTMEVYSSGKSKAECEMSEVLVAVAERDASLAVLGTELEKTQAELVKIQAELDISLQQSQANELALGETEELRGNVHALQEQVAQKEEFIKGLEYDINLLEDTGSTETEQKQEVITQLQKELEEKSVEIRTMTDHVAKLEGDLKLEAEATAFVKEELVSNGKTAVAERDASVAVLETELEKTQAELVKIQAELDISLQQSQANELALGEMEELRGNVHSLQEQVAQKEELIKGLEYDINLLEETGSTETEQKQEVITQLQKELEEKSVEIRTRTDHVAKLEGDLKLGAEATSLIKEELVVSTGKCAEAVGECNELPGKSSELQMRLATLEASMEQSEFVVKMLEKELQSAQALVEEHEAVAAEARQAAEVHKTYALGKDQKVNRTSEELTITISALESQVTVLQKEVDEESQMKLQMSKLQASELLEAQAANMALERKLQAVEGELSRVQKSLDSLESQCKEKDVQLKALQALVQEVSGTSQPKPSSSIPLDVMNVEFVSELEEARLNRKTLQGVQTEGQNLSVPDVAPQEDSVDMSKEAIAAFVLAKEEVDLTVSRVEKEMQTVATEMKSLRADISKSFFEFPGVALQQDLQSAWDAHRIELSSVSEKVMILEGQLEESISKASMLQAAHDDVQEALQKSIAEQGVVERKLLASQESLESAEKTMEVYSSGKSKAECEMSEVLVAVAERDASLAVLGTELEKTQAELVKIQAELDISLQQSQANELALGETEELRGNVHALQEQVAQKEEFIKGLEYDINLLEDTGSTETEQKQEVITQLQKELEEKSVEIRTMTDHVAKLEGDLKLEAEATAFVKEELVSNGKTAVAERDASVAVLETELEKTQAELVKIQAELDISLQQSQANELALGEMEELRGNVHSLQEQVAQKEELIKGLEYDINLLEETGSTETEQKQEVITQLQKELEEKSVEIRTRTDHVAKLEGDLKLGAEATSLIKEELVVSTGKCAEAVGECNELRGKSSELQMRLATLEASMEQSEFVVKMLEKELQSAQALVKEYDTVGSEARQVETLRDQVAKLEDDLKLQVEAMALMKEEFSASNSRSAEAVGKSNELPAKSSEIQVRLGALEASMVEKESIVKVQASKLLEAQAAKLALESKLQAVEVELSRAHKSLDSLLSQREEKDAQLKASKEQVSEIRLSVGRQATEYHQKLKGLEALVEQVNSGSSHPRPTGSIHLNFMNVEFAAKSKIEELETLAEFRLKEIYMLNSKLAETESVMHDLIRDLASEKMDLANYKQGLPIKQEQVSKIADNVRRRSLESQEKKRIQEQEVEKLRRQLNEFIEERESWLEEINRRQAEMVAARVTAEKMRYRDENLTAINEKLKTENAGQHKRIGELEQDVKKLSGQQNLQQRIHHHAKIKDENNALQLQVEDLGAKLRRTEMMFARVNDELARYRTAAGKTPYLNIDEEQRLKSKLQEAEESKIQIAQKFISLSNGILQAAGIADPMRQVDQSAALEALRKLEARLRATEDELSEMRLKTRIAGEKRRISDMRALNTPIKQSYSSPAPR